MFAPLPRAPASLALLMLAAACDATATPAAPQDAPDASTRQDALDASTPQDALDVSTPHDAPRDASDAAATAPSCALPITAVDVSSPTRVVGTGTPASCTASALAAAVTAGGVITFDCGGPATITLDAELTLPTDRDTVIDGGGAVTLDGGGRTRILHFQSGNYRGRYGGAQRTVTVQRLTFAHGRASGSAIVVPADAPAACSRGTNIDGGGGAILVGSGVLHVIDCTFTDNQAALEGPDVAGGAVYATGSTDVTIVGSTFTGNRASNGGAIACLNSDLHLTNDTIRDNAATGTGANTIDTSMCPASVHGGEVGRGGNGGGVYLDGGDDGPLTLCGCTLARNTAGALGGGLFRTPDGPAQPTTVARCTFDANSAPNRGGGAMYLHNSRFRASDSTFSGNTAPSAGAIQADGTPFEFTNVTLVANVATRGVGGAFAVFNADAAGARASAGTLTNCTVANNEARGMNYAAFAAASFGSPFVWNNCIVANNSDNDGNANASCATRGTGTASMQWPVSHPGSGNDPPCAEGITFADPMLGALGDHGGPTLTVPPMAPDAVVRVGVGCPATDQAGHPRPTPCTLGALERGF